MSTNNPKYNENNRIITGITKNDKNCKEKTERKRKRHRSVIKITKK